MIRRHSYFFLFVLLVVYMGNIAFAQDGTKVIDVVDITAFSHPDIAEVQRGGGWIVNQYGGSGITNPTNRLAAFTWSPIGDQAKIIYYSEVKDGDYFMTGQLSMVLVQFDLTDLAGYKIKDARLVLQDNWNGSDNEFALEISRILSGPSWEPYPDPDPGYGHDWADGRSDFTTTNGYRVDNPTFDLTDNAEIQTILDTGDWPGEVVQGSCWAFRNANRDPWIPGFPAGTLKMIHEMKTWENPEGYIRSIGGTQSISSSLKDVVQGWVSGRYQNNGLVIHPSITLVPVDLSLDSAVTTNVHGGWQNYNQGAILLAIDAEQVTPAISEAFQDDSGTAVAEWSLY